MRTHPQLINLAKHDLQAHYIVQLLGRNVHMSNDSEEVNCSVLDSSIWMTMSSKVLF